MQKEEIIGDINLNMNNKSTILESHLALLEIFIEKTEDGNDLYYVAESVLYALGDRNIAFDSSSTRLLNVNMDYLDKLIKLYELTNPSITIEKQICSIDEYVSDSYDGMMEKNSDQAKEKK